MNDKLIRRSSSASTNPASSNLPAYFVQRFTHAATARARFPAPPPGSLLDPYLLDRLQAPLTRYRD